MDIADNIDSDATGAGLDFDHFRLRRFVEDLDRDSLDIREQPIDLADIAKALDGNPRAVLQVDRQAGEVGIGAGENGVLRGRSIARDLDDLRRVAKPALHL